MGILSIQHYRGFMLKKDLSSSVNYGYEIIAMGNDWFTGYYKEIVLHEGLQFKDYLRFVNTLYGDNTDNYLYGEKSMDELFLYCAVELEGRAEKGFILVSDLFSRYSYFIEERTRRIIEVKNHNLKIIFEEKQKFFSRELQKISV